MTLDELHALLTRLIDAARERLLREGRQDSVAHLVVGGVETSVAVTLAAAGDRAVVRRLFESAAREGAQACALTMTAWNEAGDQVLVGEAACPAGHVLRSLVILRAGADVRLDANPGADPSVKPLLAGLTWAPGT